MLIRHDRNKLINSIIYFQKNVDNCGKIKLFKLLYFLDFEHYKTAGRSVTGLEYSAWKNGPAPMKLHIEIEHAPKPDMIKSIEFDTNQGQRLDITPLVEFDKSNFTKREFKLLEKLCKEYKTALAGDMIEATHVPNEPWDKVFKASNFKNEIIPYDLALGDNTEVKELANEHKELVRVLS